MVYKTIAEINRYEGTTVNPMHSPDEIFELYSVPSFDTNYPEIIAGADIGSSKVTVQENDVLICKINPRINRVWVVKHYTEYPLLASSEWIVVRNSDMDADYLRWYFSSPTFRVMLNSEVAGIGGSLTRAQPKRVVQYPVPVCALEEQRYISTVLNRVESLISLRKQQIAKLDELVKARFVEMFGDPIENPMCWTTHPLDTVCNTIVDCPHSTPSYTTDNTGFMCIRTSIVKKNKILWNEIEYIPEEEYKKRIQRKKPAKGDIVYTREGAILGIAAIIDRDCNVALGQRSMLLSPNPEKCCSEFLCVAMNFDSFLRKALGGISGSASPHINVGDIKAFDIILPPLELQHQFAAFVAQTDQQKLTIQHSLAKLELLKKALMQKYFG